MTDPILIVGMPRSGTSMTAGVFARHGVWVGTHQEGDRLNAKGHFENHHIKQAKKVAAIPPAYICVNKGLEAEPVDGWREAVLRLRDQDGYEGGPWMFKMSVMFWRMFDGAFPDATWVCVRRPRDEIRRSSEATGIFSATDETIDAHIAAMDRLERERGAVSVQTSDVVAGDTSSLGAALLHADLEPDGAIIADFIDATLWRHG